MEAHNDIQCTFIAQLEGQCPGGQQTRQNFKLQSAAFTCLHVVD